ncbi:sulfur carrier protein ThiS [Nocardioides panaciterrulae]|uniref:Sulfur carrier protein n=1 Tax=Nocardioides panaciterrulae TaxID=661492 RepID=A0A7Y9JB70_9ACTN|nr:sulfur carrier protein ThiS [Nocardioides panaciterrulae]NYD42472.1 sulfur carrier protein [Nocardioides panaciterrulae]
MRLTLNGTDTELSDGTTVEQMVAERAGTQSRVAVARNGEVVPRSAWAATRLMEGDDVEVLVAVAGG